MASPQLFINEDVKIRVNSLTDDETNAYVNDATGSFDILDSSSVAVSGMTGIAMSYITSSNGDYAGYLDKAKSVLLVEQTRYFVAITLTSGARDLYRKIPVRATFHGIT